MVCVNWCEGSKGHVIINLWSLFLFESDLSSLGNLECKGYWEVIHGLIDVNEVWLLRKQGYLHRPIF